MKIITTTGLYGTGSSAITDLLSEYENVSCKGDFEIRVGFDPYGISDLEYNLIENPNRNNSSNAIKRFKKIVNHLHGSVFQKNYEKYFDGQFKKISDEYIKKLIVFEYYGRWHYDLIERGRLVFFVDRSYNKFFSIIKNLFGIKNDVNHSLLSKKEPAYATITDEMLFLSATKEYYDELFKVVNKENKEILMVDQLVPATNIKRYERYFSNITVIVVERDPRDIYLLEKYVWKGHTVPYYDIDTFCNWYIWTREMYEKSEKGNSIKIQFEDLIYEYDNTVKEIEHAIGLDEKQHIRKLQKFNPKISKNNTRLWEKYNDSNIKIIESRLKKYCYKSQLD